MIKTVSFIINVIFDNDRKPLSRIIFEIYQLKKQHPKDGIKFYFTSLLHKINAGNTMDYMPRTGYIKLVSNYYRIEGEHPILQNKNAFHDHMKQFNIKTPVRLAKISNGEIEIITDQLLRKSRNIINEINALIEKNQTIFIKQVDSEGGKGVFKLDKTTNFDFSKIQPQKEYIVEESLAQHADLDKINPHCINTLRVITVLNKESQTVEIPDCFFRMGTGNSAVDNGSSGGIFIHYDIHKNSLGDVAYKLPDSGGKSFYRHPNSEFVFKDAKLPYHDKVIEITTEAAKIFQEKELIGWDIAYTKDGPVIIEGNDNPHLTMMQISCKGLLSNEVYKKVFLKNYYCD